MSVVVAISHLCSLDDILSKLCTRLSLLYPRVIIDSTHIRPIIAGVIVGVVAADIVAVAGGGSGGSSVWPSIIANTSSYFCGRVVGERQLLYQHCYNTI